MSVNGFFHDSPLARDIYISPAMEMVIGRQHINAVVSNSRYDAEKHIIGDCEYEGHTYTVKQESFLGLTYWLAVARDEPAPSQDKTPRK